MKKNWVMPALGVVMAAVLLSGCGKKNPYGLSAREPVTVTVWHYYSGVQKEEFDRLVQSFNETEGREQGIVVEAYNKGSIDEISQLVTDGIGNKIGSEPLPDVFAAYADKVYEVDQKGFAVNLEKYMSGEELSEYVDAYIEEGRFDGGEGLKVFPVAKSTEVFAVNRTDWEKFARATGQTDAAFSTWEGIVKTAEAYYRWTDSLTETPDDGKAFFGRDAFANYMIVGSLQLGHEIFSTKDGKTVLDFDRDTMKKLWDHYYVPYVKGYFASYGKFRSDDVKTGQLVSFVGSTSGIGYFPTSVTLEDGTNYAIEGKVYPLPNFQGTSPCAVQQGAGMMILKSEEKREYAACVFLKWFTDVRNNVQFSVASGYLPVKKEAGERERMETLFKGEDGKLTSAGENLLAGLDTANTYRLYTTKPFKGGDRARSILNTSMSLKAEADRAVVEERIGAGIPGEEAAAEFLEEDNFESWYEDTKAQLAAIVGEAS